MPPRHVRLFAGTFLLAVGAARAAAPDDWDRQPFHATESTTPLALRSENAPENPLSIRYLDLLWTDAKETATAPSRWDRDDWRDFALIGGGVVLTMAALDRPLRDAAQRNRSSSSDRFFTDVQKFGTKQYGLPVLLGFYGYGAIADDAEAKTVALDGFSASVVSALVTSVAKGASDRTTFGRSVVIPRSHPATPPAHSRSPR